MAALVTLSASADGSRVAVRVGDTVRITLPENATTGYRWSVEHYDVDLLGPPAAETRAGTGVPGAAGEAMFDFTVRAPGSGEIVLRHWRRWQGEESMMRRFRVRLDVPG